MTVSREELLRPTLGDTRVAQAPYSLTALFLTAFFGGPMAILLLTAANSYRLQRLARDLPAILLALAAYGAFLFVAYGTTWGATFQADVKSALGERGMSLVSRGIALLLFGLSYLLHRREQRSTDFSGLDRPNGWVGGIAAIVVGIALQIGLLTVVFAATGSPVAP